MIDAIDLWWLAEEASFRRDIHPLTKTGKAERKSGLLLLALVR